MTFKLERASVSAASLGTIAVLAISGGLWMGAIAGDTNNNTKVIDKVIPPLTKDVADIKTGQAVMAERMKTLEVVVKELKQDQKDGFKAILEKLDKPR